LTLSEETIASVGRTESRWRTVAHWIVAAAFIGIMVALFHH
jgi:hypothetical protein